MIDPDDYIMIVTVRQAGERRPCEAHGSHSDHEVSLTVRDITGAEALSALTQAMQRIGKHLGLNIGLLDEDDLEALMSGQDPRLNPFGDPVALGGKPKGA